MTTISLCFYRGKPRDPISRGTRLVTRRHGQPLADVPAHVASVVTDDAGCSTLYEAILSGIHKRPAAPADFAWSRVVPVPQPELAVSFWESQIGHKYRMVSIDLVLVRGLMRLLRCDPNIGLIDNCHDAWICSTYAEEGLRQGGFAIHELLAATGNDFTTPTRPNDEWCAVKSLSPNTKSRL